MITLDRKTGAVLRQQQLTEEQRKQLARAFAARVLPEILERRDREKVSARE